MLQAVCANALLAAALAASGQPLFVSSPGPADQATITVDAARAGEPVSRRLFGKFTEHLYRNVYHGLWAQVVRNPGFEDWHYFFADDATMERVRKWSAQRGRAWPAGLAADWRAEGTGEVSYSLDRDAVNSEASQHIAIISLQTPRVGIRQDGVYLPVHRESDYQVSLYARARRVTTLTLTVRYGERALASVRFGELTDQWKQHRAELHITEDVPEGAWLTLVIDTGQPGDLWLDQLFIFPADNVHGFDRDVVDFCRRAKLSLLRFPGGNFVSGYHWQDGIGPVDQRPMRRNPAWHCPEYNHVGTDEWMAFCEAVGCEPLICVNAGSGTPEEAAQWVEYCNGSLDTRFGAMRARNGHPRPYNVRYWEVGNELWGDWQVGHCSADEYAERYRRFVEAMRRVDPDIQFIANGQSAEWHAPLLAKSPQLVRSFSLHSLVGDLIPADADPANVYRSLLAYPTWYSQHLSVLGEQMRQAGVKRPRLAITELQIYTGKHQLPNNGTLTEAVYLARYYHEAIRLNGLVEMITHSALVNHGGGLGKSHGVVYAQPCWWTTHVYSTMRGAVPLATHVQTPVYDVSQRGMPEVKGAPEIDAVALADDQRSVLTLMIINVNPDTPIPASISLKDWPAPKTLAGRQIAGDSFMTSNSRTTPDAVSIREIREPATFSDGKLQYTLEPHSVTELVFER